MPKGCCRHRPPRARLAPPQVLRLKPMLPSLLSSLTLVACCLGLAFAIAEGLLLPPLAEGSLGATFGAVPLSPMLLLPLFSQLPPFLLSPPPPFLALHRFHAEHRPHSQLYTFLLGSEVYYTIRHPDDRRLLHYTASRRSTPTTLYGILRSTPTSLYGIQTTDVYYTIRHLDDRRLLPVLNIYLPSYRATYLPTHPPTYLPRRAEYTYGAAGVGLPRAVHAPLREPVVSPAPPGPRYASRRRHQRCVRTDGRAKRFRTSRIETEREARRRAALGASRLSVPPY
jgi:hypothetical protein